jgi:hypothetical protein
MRRSIRFCAVVLVLAGAAGGCGGGGGGKSGEAKDTTTSSGAAPTTTPAVTCGVHDIEGVQVRTFCGNASAMVTAVNGKTSFQSGTCETAADYVSVKIGTAVLGTGGGARGVKNSTAYFELNVGRTPTDGKDVAAAGKDGTYTGSFIANDHGLATTVNQAQVNLSDNRTKGQFSGKTLEGNEASGTFTCS